jgi:Cd2+/Zn2+-exporting ATPase
VIRKVFHIQGMHCPACVMRVEGIEDELPGIHSIKASYQRGRMEVAFDETQVSEAQILLAVKQKGYEAALSR